MEKKDILKKAELLGLASILTITGAKAGQVVTNDENKIGITQTIDAKVKQPKPIITYYKGLSKKIEASRKQTKLWPNGKKKQEVVIKRNKQNKITSKITKSFNNKGVITKSVEVKYNYKDPKKYKITTTIKYKNGKLENGATKVVKTENKNGSWTSNKTNYPTAKATPSKPTTPTKPKEEVKEKEVKYLDKTYKNSDGSIKITVKEDKDYLIVTSFNGVYTAGEEAASYDKLTFIYNKNLKKMEHVIFVNLMMDGETKIDMDIMSYWSAGLDGFTNTTKIVTLTDDYIVFNLSMTSSEVDAEVMLTLNIAANNFSTGLISGGF